jgi:hypothetical protein
MGAGGGMAGRRTRLNVVRYGTKAAAAGVFGRARRAAAFAAGDFLQLLVSKFFFLVAHSICFLFNCFCLFSSVFSNRFDCQ